MVLSSYILVELHFAYVIWSLIFRLIISINKEHHNDNTRPKPLQADENSSPDQPSATVDNGRNHIETTNVGSCSTKHVKDVKQSDLRQKEQKLRKRKEELMIREKLNEEMQNERIWLRLFGLVLSL
jgi:ABC-type nickel/cobalt efflux system permease component RcnA